MNKLKICRLCLVGDVRMHVVDKNLQEIYEKLNNTPFVTEDRPMIACFICYKRLKQCCQLQQKCLEAEKLLADMSNEDCEGQLELSSEFMVSPMEITSIVEYPPIEHYLYKKELQPDCDGQEDVEVEEQQSDDGGVQADEDEEDKI